MLNFTLKQLRYVEATGRLGSIARAATDLNISQSSITAAIDTLEMQIGYDLFICADTSHLAISGVSRTFVQHSAYGNLKLRLQWQVATTLEITGNARGTIFPWRNQTY